MEPNREPRSNSSTCDQSISKESTKNPQWERIVFNKWCCKNLQNNRIQHWPSFLLCYCNKHWPVPAWGRKGWLGSQVTVHLWGKLRQELKWGPWRNGAYWLASLACPATLHSPGSPPALGLAFVHQLAKNKMLQRWWKDFKSQWWWMTPKKQDLQRNRVFQTQ